MNYTKKIVNFLSCSNKVVDHILKDYLTLKSKKIIGDFASN